ncbi:MAG: adenylate/guanylate cyclase domain-containing protein [Rhodocyclaceae bacterium]|nr:adenylate/guanylate cyclase domain-containing protein [Rhodocyclaceae bacterium]
MKKTLARTLLGLALLVAMLGHASHFWRFEFIERLDAIAYDARLRLTMPGGLDERIVILDIDEKSLNEQGHWPWGRDRLATLIDKLFDRHGARLVAFDVVFAEADDSSGLFTLEALARRELKHDAAFQTVWRSLRPRLDFDARFAAALQGRKVILGYYLSNLPGGQVAGVLPAPTLPAEALAGRPIAITRWQSFGANLPVLQEAAAGAGHFNPLVDFDGISRRVPLLAEYAGAYYEALSLAVLRALYDFPPLELGFADDVSLEWLALATPQGRLTIPVDENVATLIPYRGPPGSFRYVSVTDVLNDRVAPGLLKDRIVLVGASAPGLMDLRATPVAAAYPGVEVHANLIAGMLDGKLRHKPAYLLAVDGLQILLAGLVMIFLAPRLSPLKTTLAGFAVLGGLIALNLSLWQAGLVLPFAAAVLTALLLYALDMSWGYFVEARTKRQFAELFGQYVPPELVEEMAKNPAGYSMAGKRAELTVLFSDVRGFTTISEGLPPEELAALMNEYLGAMTAVIRRHRGTLDKYIGDAIMAFWGAPVADPEHARHAVQTALEMHAALVDLNRDLQAKGWPALKIGVGINTGPMTVGDMGSPVRKAYTVMGDAVNLGSRLEGITKQYGVGIILGEGTREKLGQDFVLRELDRVRVKGKAEPVGIYEPLGRAGEVDAATLARLERWHEALAAYRAQDWPRAEALLAALQHEAPHALYDLYLRRISHYRAEPPGPDWDGVTTFETK